jgi:hypothetical protein
LSTANQNRIQRAGQSEYDWICQVAAHLAQKRPSMKQVFLFCAAMMAAVVVQASPPAPAQPLKINRSHPQAPAAPIAPPPAY